MDLYTKLTKEMAKKSCTKQALISKSFFKTDKGDYAENDIFIGIKVPIQRKIAKKYLSINLNDLKKLLKSKIHEHRYIALIILNEKLIQKNNSNATAKEIYNFYIKNIKQINNWDLVDISAPKIVGNYLLKKIPKNKREKIYSLAKSKNLWEKRISIVSTLALIKENQFNDALKISKILLNDNNDLIHKAVGWMLREIGKKNRAIEESFLKDNLQTLPRTTLRYATEKFPKKLQKKYLQKNKIKKALTK